MRHRNEARRYHSLDANPVEGFKRVHQISGAAGPNCLPPGAKLSVWVGRVPCLGLLLK